MLRVPIEQRENWQVLADEFGFKFHTMYGQVYWDESAFYQFNLKQIEQDLEQPTEQIHQMCLQVVEKVVEDDSLLKKFCIPREYWSLIKQSWKDCQPSLYSRFDFCYDGKNPAKFLENNADTPTSLYETGFWQWLWLENNVDNQKLSASSDQFNSLQEKLVNRFKELKYLNPEQILYFSCCKDTEEDRGTVQYLQDCAQEAGIENRFIYVEDIGATAKGKFTDLDDNHIQWMFKLYPWEFMFQEEFGPFLLNQQTLWLEPPWKAILSNKALLPMLWKLFPDHPNLLPAFFEDEINEKDLQGKWVKKPIFSREGSNISIIEDGKTLTDSSGPYGEEGYIYQQFHQLPKFENNYTLIGSWLVDNQSAGISVREDASNITQDLSRYLPHIIVG